MVEYESKEEKYHMIYDSEELTSSGCEAEEDIGKRGCNCITLK